MPTQQRCCPAVLVDLDTTGADLDRARRAVVACVRALIGVGTPLPPVLLDAYAPLARMESACQAHAEARRVEVMAVPMHYVAEVGDRKTLCGVPADEVPHGWVGADNEFYLRRIERGGMICEHCRVRVEK